MATSMVVSFAVFTLLTATTSLVHGWDVKVTASEAIFGKEATIQCDFIDVDGTIIIANTLDIKSGGTTYVTYAFGRNLLIKDPQTEDPRYSFNTTTQTLTISSVNCDDGKKFSCELSVLIPGTGNGVKENEADIVVKMRPGAPDPMTTIPSNLTVGVLEGGEVKATCVANIGRPTGGYIMWRIYRDNQEEKLIKTDSRIAKAETSPQVGEPYCSQRHRSTLTLSNLQVQDQNLVLTCFVMSDDFPSNPVSCESTADSLCQQSETIRIYYSVRDIKVSREPQSTITEGSDVKLKCKASGFPAPSYEWSKVGENRTLSSQMDGMYSVLDLNGVDIDEDSGDYNCTATNLVKGTSHSLSDEVNVNVVERPLTTTPPEPNTSSMTTGDGKPSPKKSSDDDDTTIIIVVVVVVIFVVIAVIVAVCVWKKHRGNKEDPPRPKENPFYNNKQTMGSPPDVLGEDKKKPISGTLNSSFNGDNGDGLMYADLTYDNRPRSRKPMAIGDASSDYSDVQMPQV